MRKLNKSDKPEYLRNNETTLTAAYLVDNSRTPWRHDAIKNQLRTETMSKCAYCESRVEHVAPMHIEHIIPKVAAPELVASWENLTLACAACNSAKGTYYSIEEPLLNPYLDNPVEHLVFVGAAVFCIPASGLGSRSIRILDLMRPKLMAERERAIQSLHLLLSAWARASDLELKAVIRSEILEMLADDAQYSAASLAFARLMGLEP